MDGNGARPAEAHEEKKEGSQRVQVPQGVQAEPPLALGRVVPKEVGGVGVAHLVENEAHHQGKEGEEEGEGVFLEEGDHSPRAR